MGELRDRWRSGIRAAEGAWDSHKLGKYEKPDSAYPDLPGDLTDICNEELVRLLVVLRGWSNYVGEQMVYWRMRRDAVRSEVKAIRGRMMEELRSEIKGADERWKAMESNPDVVDASTEELKVSYVYENLEFRYDQLSKMHGTVSRALSMREAELEALKSQYGDGPGYRQRDPHEMDD
jgi:hypothetical protein